MRTGVRVETGPEVAKAGQPIQNLHAVCTGIGLETGASSACCPNPWRFTRGVHGARGGPAVRGVRYLLLLPYRALTLGSYAALPFPTREGPPAALPSPAGGQGGAGCDSPSSPVASGGYGCPLSTPVMKNDPRPGGRMGPPAPATEPREPAQPDAEDTGTTPCVVWTRRCWRKGEGGHNGGRY